MDPALPARAVFLSYASQDAEAARRIANALRAAGVEVWFDQSELVGGDAWDAKIRKQIKDCALLIPIISANTNARAEGYFRLEWKLAVDRSHLMADDAAFLFPIIIGDVADATARVPEKFREVQWTRLRLDETPDELAARVAKLLSWEPGAGNEESDNRGHGAEDRSGRSTRRPAWLRYAWAGVGILFALVYAVRPLWQQAKPRETPAAGATARDTELERVRARIIPDRWQRQDFDALSSTLERIVQANPEEAEAWALLSIINSLQVTRNQDSGTKPLTAGKSAAERALRLAPDNPLGELALGLHYIAMTSRGGDVHAARAHLERAVAGLPPDALTRYAELVSYWLGFQFENTERCARAWLAAEPQASFPAWIMAQMNLTTRHPAEAVQWAEQAAADRDVTGVRALATMFEARYYLQADLPAARAALDRQAAGGQTVHRMVFARWLQAMAEHRWDLALQEPARLPEPILFDRNFHGPKALLAGLAHRAAGRPEAMTGQFRESERLAREELARDPDNEELHAVLALTLACTGRASEARAELAAVEPLMSGRTPSVYTGQLIALIAQSYAELGEPANTVPWLRKLLVEPSVIIFTPASLRLDPRFSRVLSAPEIQALLKEFAHLDQPAANATAPKADDKSVAVLAFANLSDDKENEYFSDGISEELLNVLAKIPGLKVSARTSAFSFKGRNVAIPEIAQKLGVAYVMEGSVRKAGSRVRITAQLIKAADGFHVWSETYDRELKDIFAVQDEIATAIMGAVKISLMGGAEPPRALTTKIEAYTLFLQAQSELAKRGDAGLREASRLFEAALAIDPGYVPAWVGQALACALLPNYASLSGPQAREMIDRSKQAAQRALELDPRNAEAYAVLGWVHALLEWHWSEGEGELLRARELAPNNGWVANFTGDYYRFVRDDAAALAAKKLAWELGPLDANNHWDLAYTYLVAGDYEQAIHWGELTIGLAPHNIDGYQPVLTAAAKAGRLDLMRRMLTAARQNVHENEGLLLQLEVFGAIYEKRPEEAHRLFAQVKPLVAAGRASPAFLGYLHLLLGESAEARNWLQQAYDARDTTLVWPEVIDFNVIAADPVPRPILDLPGLKELYELRMRNTRSKKP